MDDRHNFERALIVSCQADPGTPFDHPDFITAFARAAAIAGSRGLRLEGAKNIAAVRTTTTLPIIGLIKKAGSRDGVYITPTLEDVTAVMAAGADIVAFDATLRPRPVPVRELICEIHAQHKLALADIATVQDAEQALESGADYVSTTLSGYTLDSPALEGPDFALIADLAAQGIRPFAEGRIRTPQEAREALMRGAHAVVIGSAITRPEVITRWFIQALEQAPVQHAR